MRRLLHAGRSASAAAGASAAAPSVRLVNPLRIAADELRTLLQSRKGAWPVTEPIVSPHAVIYSPPSPPPKSAWTPASRRVGVLALKAGMTSDWDKWGVRHALTVLRLEDVIVTGVVEAAERGYTAVQVGAALPKLRNVNRARAGHFASVGVAPRRHLAEFRVTPEAVCAVGTPLLARHFVPGQMVKVTGTSQGKGFQGAMKRHGFAGQGASHGNSVSHRAIGATGCRQDPGKVIKGKKMPGHMGEKTISIDVQVFKIDIKSNLIYIKGAVPGKPGTYLSVSDSLREKFSHEAPPPFPTYSLTGADNLALAKWAANAYLSPEDELRLSLRGELPAEYEREPPFEIVCPPPDISPFAVREDDEPEGE